MARFDSLVVMFIFRIAYCASFGTQKEISLGAEGRQPQVCPDSLVWKQTESKWRRALSLLSDQQHPQLTGVSL